MTTLSKDQISFLIEQKIPLSTVFDAKGLGQKQYYSVMKDLGKKVAIGVTPCRKAGHTLRTRHHHCIQCNTAAMTFLSRFDELGSIYIAGSRKGKIIKVGFSNDTLKREKTLNNYGYGGFNDWQILYFVECQDGGRVEFRIHKELAVYNTPRQYLRDNYSVDCLELFQCGYGTAIDAFEQVFNQMGIVEVSSAWESPTVHDYHFPDVLSKGANRKGFSKSSKEVRPHRQESVLSNSVSHLRSAALRGNNKVDSLPLALDVNHKVKHKKYPGFTDQIHPHENVKNDNTILNTSTHIEIKPKSSVDNSFVKKVKKPSTTKKMYRFNLSRVWRNDQESSPSSPLWFVLNTVIWGVLMYQIINYF